MPRSIDTSSTQRRTPFRSSRKQVSYDETEEGAGGSIRKVVKEQKVEKKRRSWEEEDMEDEELKRTPYRSSRKQISYDEREEGAGRSKEQELGKEQELKKQMAEPGKRARSEESLDSTWEEEEEDDDDAEEEEEDSDKDSAEDKEEKLNRTLDLEDMLVGGFEQRNRSLLFTNEEENISEKTEGIQMPKAKRSRWQEEVLLLEKGDSCDTLENTLDIEDVLVGGFVQRTRSLFGASEGQTVLNREKTDNSLEVKARRAEEEEVEQEQQEEMEVADKRWTKVTDTRRARLEEEQEQEQDSKEEQQREEKQKQVKKPEEVRRWDLTAVLAEEEWLEQFLRCSYGLVN